VLRSMPRGTREAGSRRQHGLWSWPLLVALVVGCDSGENAGTWLGTVDTLPGGVVQVTNPATGIWDAEAGWQVTEVMRVGSADGDGPDLFGRVGDFEVDASGRIYVFDSQAQELRIFGVDGLHVRTVGRKGGGPGEFSQVIGMDWSPGGDLWLLDPNNNRISVIDTNGTYVTSHPALGGFIVMPWSGGFDNQGRFYTYGIDPDPEDENSFPMVFVRYNEALQPTDTTDVPRYQGNAEYFEARSGDGFMRAGVPHSPGLRWRLARNSDFWFILTGEYEIVRRTFEGDTLSVFSKAFTPLPVTSADLEEAREDLEWFTRQGGQIDLSKVPDIKPAIQNFFLDDRGNIWVEPTMAGEDQGRVFDVFDRAGRYLGQVRFPFVLQTNPTPVFVDDFVYGITTDDLEVPYVVKARLGRPAGDTGAVTVGAG